MHGRHLVLPPSQRMSDGCFVRPLQHVTPSPHNIWRASLCNLYCQHATLPVACPSLIPRVSS
eukprot:scaffold64415_cov27-Tisochrysis_lutea.AAC.1